MARFSHHSWELLFPMPLGFELCGVAIRSGSVTMGGSMVLIHHEDNVMGANEKESKKSTDLKPVSAAGSLSRLGDFDDLFDDFLSRRWPRLFDWEFPSRLERAGFPKVDIIDHDNEIEVQAALPGVKKEDLEVTINNQSISIRAVTREEKKEEGKYFRREISRGEFQRTLSLPDNVDNDNAKASFKDGLLKITIPKTEKSRRKSIEIK
jgi:HSP20 family protein